MKNLIISSVCLLLLIISWYIYSNHANFFLNECSTILKNEVIPLIESEDWDAAAAKYEYIAVKWTKFKNTAEFFIDTSSVNEVEKLICKLKYYIILHDSSNSAALCSELIQLLNCITENETLSPGNVF